MSFLDEAHHFRRLDVHHLLDHPLVVAARHRVGHLGGEEAQAGIARLRAGVREAGVLPEAGVEQVDEGLAVFPGPEQIALVVLHGRRQVPHDLADERRAVGLAQLAVHRAVGELHEKGDELGEHVGHQAVRAEAEAFLLHVLEDLGRDLPHVRADHARALGERALALLAPAGLDERDRGRLLMMAMVNG